MNELVDLDIPEHVRERLKEDVLGDFICRIKYEQDEEAYYIIAEPWPQYDAGIIQVRMPKEEKDG